MLYVDNGAFRFPSRKELEIDSAVVCLQFIKFGLKMHVGSTIKASKTEAVHFPDPGFVKLPALPPSEASSSSLPLVAKPKQESDVKKRAREERCYDNLQETQPIILTDGGIITLYKHFKYLGHFISYSLRNDFDINHRLSQVSSAMAPSSTSGQTTPSTSTASISSFAPFPSTSHYGDAKVGRYVRRC